jgi:5-methylcytosine-specific restriction protein A
MISDVGTTERKRLTPSQKLKLYELQRGICPLCDQAMRRGEKLIDEHLRSLGLGGTNDLGNRAIAHALCAALKTHGPDGDLARIAKAKAQKRASLGFKDGPKIQSAGFRTSEPKRRATSPIPKLSLLYKRTST